MSENVTKPTIETILERMTALEERLGARLDRIESISNITRGEMLDLRAEFRELRVQLKGTLSRTSLSLFSPSNATAYLPE
jgi:hypothetical protein